MRVFRANERGFTLPELVVVGSLFVVLAIIALVLVRPADYAAERRDAKRRTDVARILQAISAYKNERGTLPPRITTDEDIIASEEVDQGLCSDLVPAYLPDLPVDPSPQAGLKLLEDRPCSDEEQLYATGYTVRKTEEGAVIVAAPAAENGEEISLTR